MSSQIVPIHRTDGNNKDTWFNPFDYQPGQDTNIRWLSRPNLDLIRSEHGHDTEKFRITFDVENFQPEQIKIYIQNRKLTISGVYEERSEGRFMQKQFERSFDLPANADVDSMASFITENHMLVVEIPLHTTNQVDHLKVNANDQRRLSFSLNKFNSSNQGNLLSANSDLPPSGQNIRRTSMTKTTTTTTTSGSHALPPEASELLRNAEDSTTTTGGSSHTYTSQTTERRSSNVGQPTSTTKTLTATDLANLPIEIPPELLASGGTITIQKRKVSVTKSAAEPSTSHTQSTSNVTSSTSSNTSNALSQPSSSTTSSSAPSTTSSSTSERRSSKTISSSNQSRMLTLEEFLQNQTWNPTLVDGPNGKKMLHMRLQMKPGTTLDQMKISINGHDLRIEVDNKVTNDSGRVLNEHSYRQITLFPTCEMDQLKTELKDDGYLHIQVPMTL